MTFLVDKILDSAQPDHSPLPSIRQLAKHYGVATVTVHKALRLLQGLGKIYAIPAKGFFWGNAPSSKPLLTITKVDTLERVREQLFADFQCGVFHPGNPLPKREALAQLYKISAARMALLLRRFWQEGVLVRLGRSYFLAPPAGEASLATVLVVSRCNAEGQLLFDSERETDFMKALQRERLRLGLAIAVVGWYENAPGKGIFLDRHGVEFRPQSVRGVLLGAIVSTWLMGAPVQALAGLWKWKIPVSVWWEQPRELFPRAMRGRPSTVGFNISFGQSAGMQVGKHLHRQGVRSVAFISPFHGSEWSRNRLEGLREGYGEQQGSIVEITDSTYDSAATLHRQFGTLKGERKIREILAGMLERNPHLQEMVWVTVNDHTALVLLELLKTRNVPFPYIVSFDNSTIAESYRIDSFEFHTEGMVRQMFYHLLQPQALLYKEQGLHEMVGRLVVRA